LAESDNFYDHFVQFQTSMGMHYFTKGEYDLALEYLEPSLSLAEKMRNANSILFSLIFLVNVHLQRDAIKEVQKYLERLKRYESEWENRSLTHTYLLLKAVFLLETGGSIFREEAETILKQVSTNTTQPTLNAAALIYLCEFYLEDLNQSKDTGILKKITPLIAEIYKISEEQRLYRNLAEAKLLQAKVALIQMDFEETQRLLTQAQRVAEMYGITLTAQKISSEHDNYLEKLNEWKKLKEKDVPISERIKFAEVDGVIERLQRRRVIEAQELEDEEPIVLLIMDKSGISYFNHPFIENWDSDWIFSSFMSAFDTFSSEVFSESIDRIKIGDNLILVNPIESFLVCYVIKGQSYLGLQKLNRFSKAIKDNSEIWETLNRATQTGEALELDKPRSLGVVVNEIFA
ncbi:MAG: hypothetical protein ACW99F_13950, partial [Candidatus Hodarchaeales archaeon]